MIINNIPNANKIKIILEKKGMYTYFKDGSSKDFHVKVDKNKFSRIDVIHIIDEKGKHSGYNIQGHLYCELGISKLSDYLPLKHKRKLNGILEEIQDVHDWMKKSWG